MWGLPGDTDQEERGGIKTSKGKVGKTGVVDYSRVQDCQNLVHEMMQTVKIVNLQQAGAGKRL